MSELKWLHVQGLENHNELVEFTTELQKLSVHVNNAITGTEGYQEVLGTLGHGMGSLGSGLLTTVGWVGGKTVGIFANVLGGAGNLLSKAFSDNDVLIKKVVQQFSRAEEHEVSFSKANVNLLTADGNLDDLNKDMDNLIHTLELIDKHSKELHTYLDARMGVLRGLRGIDNTEQVYALIDKHDAIKYPVLDFSHHMRDGAYQSDVLPGGKVLEFYEPPQVKYLMNGDTPDGASANLSMSKSEVSALLTKLDKVNGMHKRFKAAYEDYLNFIKSWGDMVRSVEGNMSKLDKVSKSALKDAEKLLGGEPTALAFYSGFTPRVISYTDRYIHGVLGVFV